MSAASEVFGLLEEANRASVRIGAGPRAFSLHRVFLTSLDAVIVTAASVVSLVVLSGQTEAPAAPRWMLCALTGLVWMGLLAALGSREAAIVANGVDELVRVVRASAYTLLAALAAAAALHDPTWPAALALVVGGTPVLLAGRLLARRRLRTARETGALAPAVVVGTRAAVRDVATELVRSPRAGYLPAALCVVPSVDDAAPSAEPVDGVPAVAYERLPEFVRSGSVSAVMVVDGLSRAATRELCWSLEGAPVELLLVPGLTDVGSQRIAARSTGGLCLLRVALPRYEGAGVTAKRVFDVLFSGAVLVLLSPLLALIAVLIKLDDGGPVFFRQQRVGQGGEPFVILKFRSMCSDAEARKRELKGSLTHGPLFKLGDDPRVTRIGRFLRKTSLDELPQFWTVLKGDMSVVGPRPHLAHELAGYPPDGLRRLLIKPGITGLWQVSGRSDLAIDEAVRLDLQYVENRSFATDIAIILRTVGAVLRPRGAY